MTTSERISRNEFLKSLGLKGAALMAVYCGGSSLTACSNSATVIPKGTLLTIDLTATTNAALKTVGGYIRQNDVVVARVSTTSYVAVTQICSHEQQHQVIYQGGIFYCTAHGAQYNTSGKGLNGAGSGGLTVFTVAISGNTLTVTNP